MITLLRLRPYFRSLWSTVVFGLVCMALFSLFSGFSIALTMPIVEKVFMRDTAASSSPLGVPEGLSMTGEDIRTALDGTGPVTERLSRARTALTEGLRRIQDRAAPLEILAWLCGITVAAVLLKNLFDVLRRIAFIRVEQAVTEALRRDLFQHVLNFPLASVHRITTGQLMARVITDVEIVKQLTINNAATFVHNLLLVTVYLAITIWASPSMAAASLLIVPPVALLTSLITRKLRKQSGRAQARIAELTSSLGETLAGIRIVKGFGVEPRENRRFAEKTSQYRRAVVRLFTLDSLAGPLSEFWGVVIGVSVLYYGGRLVLESDSTLGVGRFFLFFFALVSTLHPLKELVNTVARFQRGAAAASRVFEILDIPGEQDAPGALPVAGLEREIVFDDVSFAYAGRGAVLRGVSFTAPAGTTTALVGPSGAGKSTLVDLIPRFHDSTGGVVRLDGVDITTLRRRDLRALIGIVSQDPILFNDTVAENIAFGAGGSDRDRIVSAARAANAHEFITALPEGYDTRIGERGVFLSGGQRQRLAIARAIFRDPAILILDEATSSLDAESESLVQEALDRLLAGRTTFIIAHRLSTVRQADRILVLDEGRIVDAGTHEELLAREGLYRRLHLLQFRDGPVPSLGAPEADAESRSR